MNCWRWEARVVKSGRVEPKIEHDVSTKFKEANPAGTEKRIGTYERATNCDKLSCLTRR